MISEPSNTRIDELAGELREGALSDEQSAELQALIAEDAEARRRLVEHTFLQAMLAEEFQAPAAVVPDRRPAVSIPASQSAWWRYGAVAAAAGLVIAVLWFVSEAGRQSPVMPTHKPNVAAASEAARFEAMAHARFFARSTPKPGTAVTVDREYVLERGMVRLRFLKGASATVEGPAVFGVMTDGTLELSRGRCSVHVPPGAEGFTVETPEVRLIDRGTRFALRVGPSLGTEVHTVEGAVDVMAQDDGPSETSGPKAERRLRALEAMRFWRRETLTSEPVSFSSQMYKDQLPDRIVSYRQAPDADGHPGRLKSLRVQRGGVEQQIPADRLIVADLRWFKSTRLKPGLGHLIGPGPLPADPSVFLSDLLLSTGVNNPGGSKEPLRDSPNMQPGDPAGTAGFAVRFREPVVNGPGPDVVFFEIQTAGQPPEGDGFHVSPLPFAAGRRTHTVGEYDLTMRSSEALSVGRLNVFFYEGPVRAIERLRSVAQARKRQGRFGPYRVLAVGIDLSDLGVALNQSVTGLFFQDAMDDGHRVDPVLIAGLPRPEKTGNERVKAP
ncbi:MAG: hypothetical protein R3236_09115 [Phycisphaeraceae bacterium]|nr:hypothetical protein [Phycisphaeraceae bacterium]